MLLLFLGRLFLLARSFLLGICLRSRWSPPFPLHALALIPLSLTKVRLSPILTLSLLMIWCFGQTALFLLERAAPAFLPTALSVATLSFSAGPVCPSFSAEACDILHALCWSRQHQQVCHFSSLLLLSDSRSVLSSIFPLISNSVADLSSLSSCSIRLQWVPGHWFLPGNDAADGLRYLRLPQSLVVSLLLSLVSTLVFSRTGGVLSHRSILTHRFPRFPPRILCSLVMLAVSSLVVAATDIAFFLGSYVSRIGRIENPSCSACGHSSQDTSHLILHCPATGSLRRSLLATLCLVMTSGPDPGELPGFWGSMVFRHALIPRNGSGKQQQQHDDIRYSENDEWCSNTRFQLSDSHIKRTLVG